MFSRQDSIISVIFTVKNAGIDLFMALESMKLCESGYNYEVIIVDEGSVDGCCDFLTDYNFPYPIKNIKATAKNSARNIGVSVASGDYYIFCNPRLYFEDEWMTKLLKPVMENKTWAVSPALQPMGRNMLDITSYLPNPWAVYIDEWLSGSTAQYIPMLSQECFAISAEKLLDIGGFDYHFNNKQIEIYEFSLRIWLFGGTCYYEPAALLTSVYRVNVPNEQVEKNWGDDLMLMAQLHFNEARITQCLNIIKSYFPDNMKTYELTEEIMLTKQYYEVRRYHDDNWFSEWFGIDEALSHINQSC